MSIKYKLITGFLLIVLINGASGFLGVSAIKSLGNLVRKTYDNALMSGTFALSMKYDFSQFDLEVQRTLIANSNDEINLHSAKALKAFRTLKEDLQVYSDRAISKKDNTELNSLLTEVEARALVLIQKKKESPKSSRSDLFSEWANNSIVKKTYRVLTAKYDASAEEGYKFRLLSEDEVNSNQKRTTIILVLSLLSSLLLSIIMSYLLITPLMKLQKVCIEIYNGNFKVRTKVEGRDEFGTLSSSFNLMLDNIDDKTESMSSLLSTIPFSLFYFDEQGRISNERSKTTDKIFPDFKNWKTLEDFFESHGVDASKIQIVVKSMFSNSIPFNSAAFLLPQLITTTANGKELSIKLSYQAKRLPSKKLDKVIILGEDITEKEKSLAKSLELTERVDRITKVSLDQASFREFHSEMIRFFNLIKDKINTNDEPGLQRDLHSAKGMLGVFSFTELAKKIHEIESALSKMTSEKLLTEIENLADAFEKQSLDVVQVLGLNLNKNLKSFDETKFEQLKKLIVSKKDPSLNRAISDLDKFPLPVVLSKFSHYADTLTNQFEDKKIEIVFGESDEVTFDEIQKIESAIIHILNNSIDHGIESATERALLKKNEIGKIEISCRRNPDHSLQIKISDDGKGIDGEYLFEKAVKNGILRPAKPLSIEEKNNLIFLPGLSSKDESTMISGRGVGMDAVKGFLESLGGFIKLETAIGIGTSFELYIPNK